MAAQFKTLSIIRCNCYLAKSLCLKGKSQNRSPTSTYCNKLATNVDFIFMEIDLKHKFPHISLKQIKSDNNSNEFWLSSKYSSIPQTLSDNQIQSTVTPFLYSLTLFLSDHLSSTKWICKRIPSQENAFSNSLML